MLRRIIILISVGLVAGVYANGPDNSSKIVEKLESIMAKAGISISGEFKSQYFSSSIEGEGVDSSKRQKETNEFTSVDFDIKARPNEAVSARVMFRMHQNWQNFFSDVSNPIFSRWISIDGNPLGMFRFNIGDFKEKYSPLTLHSPEVDILYEPYIFARQREIAMNELFLGDNYRVLQGLNLGFDAEIVPIFNEFHLGLIATRLAGAETSVKNGSYVVANYQKTDMSKYLSGVNLDMTFLKGIELGGTWMIVFDHKGSYSGKDTTADTMAQKTNIVSLRPEINLSKMFSLSESFNLKLKTEFAVSMDDSTWVIDSANMSVVPNDNNGMDTIYGKAIESSSINGAAINIGAEIGYSADNAWGIKINGDYISNDLDFRNTMAQSPTFYGQRIMNFESDILADAGPHYTTFDALYHSVFKFTPSDKGDYWFKSPFYKTSYYRGVLLNQQNLYDFMYGDNCDPSVQLIMPLGPATPNRTGINADAVLWFLNGGLEAKGIVSLLKEKEPYTYSDTVINMPKTEFNRIGGGIKIDLSKFASVIKYPFELSGSIVQSKASNAGINEIIDDQDSLKFKKSDITSNFLNAGIYYNFWKRAALLGGFQLITNNAERGGNEVEQTQKHWTLGLEWKINDGADVVGSFGQIIAEMDTTKEWYGRDGLSADGGDFKQWLIDVSLRVKF